MSPATTLIVLLISLPVWPPIEAAYAQSFDGVYKGTRLVTHVIHRPGADRPNCSPEGDRRAVTLDVKGGVATLRVVGQPPVYSGQVLQKGKFSLSGEWITSSLSRVPVTVTWTGVIAGANANGSFIGTHPSGDECRGTFTAKR
jgi:hypothetical protein